MNSSNREHLRTVLINLWVYPLLVVWTALSLVIAAPLVGFFMLRDGFTLDRAVRHIIWLYGKSWLLIIRPFVDFKVEKDPDIEVPRSCIYVINHLSFFDTYFMGALPHSDIIFAVRSWPFKMFWYRAYMHYARYLDVETLPWDEIYRRGRAALDNGGTVLFFPEGHRSRDGRLHRFYAGAFHLAVQSGYPIVPLCIVGTDILLPPGRSYLKPARVRLRILPPVDSRRFSGEHAHRQLRQQVREEMARTIAAMQNHEQ